MEQHYSIFSYLTAGIAYSILLLLSLWGIKKYSSAVLFFNAVLFSCIWAFYTAYNLYSDDLYTSSILPLETLRNLAWFIYLLAMINTISDEPESLNESQKTSTHRFFQLFKSKYSATLIIAILVIFVIELIPALQFKVNQLLGMDIRLISHVSFAIIGLILIEQLYRNTISEHRWGIKFICLGLGGLFIFDFIIYSKSLLFEGIDYMLWNARGIVNALIVPLLAISVVRLQEDSRTYTISRKVIFHTTALVGTGLYLIIMSLAGFYIKKYGGDWGDIAQILFIFLAVLILLVLMFSGALRARLKVYFNKHFVHYRYDYRDEWIKLSKTLAELNSFNELSHFMIKTLADLVDSSCGGLWLKNDNGDYYLAENYNLNLDNDWELIPGEDAAVKFLEKKQWVIDFYEYQDNPEIYQQIDFSYWLEKKKNAWLMIPILQQNQLKAFVVLTKPRAPGS